MNNVTKNWLYFEKHGVIRVYNLFLNYNEYYIMKIYLYNHFF